VKCVRSDEGQMLDAMVSIPFPMSPLLHMPTPSAAALLIIDVQRAIDHPSWGRRNNLDAEDRMAALLKHWRQCGWPVVHIRHSSRDPASTYRPGQEGIEFKLEVQPQANETVFTKHTNSAFIGTELDWWLRSRRIGTLVICGVITNNSVEATARMAGNLGYRTYVVADATYTFDKVDQQGCLRAAEEVHAMSLSNLNGEYAAVVSSDQVLRGIETQPARGDHASLESVRSEINRIDRQLVALLAERGECVKQAARFKRNETEVASPDRVEQVIATVRSLAIELGANAVVTEKVYRTMIAEFIAAELQEYKKL
jgi:nicotinamidase-related amidase/chorismate mutase